MFRFSSEDVVDDTAGEIRPEDDGKPRRVRADAQRNLDALLRAAMAVFATSGVDAPVREIAEKAGVGIGTVYRHFPQRSDLIIAVFRQEVDACADAAPALAAAHDPGEALSRWIRRYLDFIAA
ncbi:TetR/AcrR family transcriptional regulator, partial [Nitrospirillum viridazoti]